MSVYDPASLRSHSLLRDTLLRDHSLRNSSSASLPLMSSPPKTPTRTPHRPHPVSQPPRRPHTRDPSHSPLATTSDSHPHLVTPHEQVLRARLERVLFSAGLPHDRRERGRPRSPSPEPFRRNRSMTESNIPPMRRSHFVPSPQRSPKPSHPLSSVSRSASLVRHKKGASTASGSASRSGKRSCTGTTPPLVPDDDEGSGGEARLSLLTPPATPSPPGFGLFQVSDWGYKVRCYDRTPEDDEDDDEEDDESCSSSYSSYREGSSISSSALRSSFAQPPAKAPLYPKLSPGSPHTPSRPFNARRASAQCRAIEGYVSFANVEGLGVPPDDAGAASPQERGGKGVFGWGGGVVRKILGGGGEKEEGAVAF